MRVGALIAPSAESAGHEGEQSRACYPDSEGFVERDGMNLFYELYGEGEETIFLLPTWSLVHSRFWKMQIPYFARHFRVLTMDGLGNGRSDRCLDPRRYGAEEFARDCLAVMDATDTDRAVTASWSRGAQFQLEMSRLAPERFAAAAFIGPMFPYTPSHWSILASPRTLRMFRRPAPAYRWRARMNANHWRQDYPAFAEWFISRFLPEPRAKGVTVRWPRNSLAGGETRISKTNRSATRCSRAVETPVQHRATLTSCRPPVLVTRLPRPRRSRRRSTSCGPSSARMSGSTSPSS